MKESQSSVGVSCLIEFCLYFTFLDTFAFSVLDLRSSPGTMSCSSPDEELIASPDCSIICDDKDFFKLVSFNFCSVQSFQFHQTLFLLGFRSNESSKGNFYRKTQSPRKFSSSSETSVNILKISLSKYYGEETVRLKFYSLHSVQKVQVIL